MYPVFDGKTTHFILPNVGVFKNMHFCTFLLNLFKTNYCFVIHKVHPLVQMVLSFKSLFEKDLY